MSFIKEFTERGYFYQATDLEALTNSMANQKITAYIGFDCTAKSLHIGNLMQIMILRLLQQHGHKPIILLGGGTTKIGDPSGRDETRKLLTPEVLADNKAGIKRSLEKFLTFNSNSKNDALIVDNDDWLASLKYIDFLQEFGRLFSVNRMLTMDSVRLRLEREQPLTFLEFNYMLLQSYDFYYLNRHYGCILQLGGSDQWGNIIMGADLVKKMGGKEVYGMTTPLLTSSSGAKMGKSVSGAVWLNEDMLSPYDYFQYWRNIEDPDVVRFAKLYSEWSGSELGEFVLLAEKDINAAKKALAHRVTAMCHGQKEADEAMETARILFEEGGVGGAMHVYKLAPRWLSEGIVAAELFYIAGLATSKSEAKKLIRGGGASLNDVKIADENQLLTIGDFTEGLAKLSAGKKRHILVQLSQ